MKLTIEVRLDEGPDRRVPPTYADLLAEQRWFFDKEMDAEAADAVARIYDYRTGQAPYGYMPNTS